MTVLRGERGHDPGFGQEWARIFHTFRRAGGTVDVAPVLVPDEMAEAEALEAAADVARRVGLESES